LNPTVCAICLTADRPELTKKAVECFRAQTYENKRLLIYDTGKEPIPQRWFFREEILSGHEAQGIYYEYHPVDRGLTIGALRNLAMAFAHPLCLNADIIVTWDSDDWNHPNRITEQVALLQASGADCVGFNEMMFWKEDSVIPWDTVHCICGEKYPRSGAPCPKCHSYPEGEAWLYSLPRSNYALGTSLCYWRKTWEAKLFEDTNAGEDLRFIEGLKVKSISAIGELIRVVPGICHSIGGEEPRLIARIHGGNRHCKIDERSEQWKRAVEWDERLRKIMAL